MVAAVPGLVAGAVLLAACASKLADRPGSVVALSTYGITGRAATPAWLALIAAELLAGAAALAGVAAGAAALLVAFAGAQGVVLARGRGGAPCGCLGSHGVVSRWSLARVTALAALAAAAVAWPATASPAAALAVAAAAGAAVLATRRGGGPLDVAGEGPALGTTVDLPRGVLLFTSSGCSLCARVKRGLRGFVELDEQRDAAAWAAAGVPGAPYAVVVDDAGVVRAKGTVNRAADVRALAGATSRRVVLGRAAAAASLLAGVGRLVKPGTADAYHFCGHIYTTDSCPHPTGLPRIDHRGFPLRARDGHPVDDLGRPIAPDGTPLGDDGQPLRDPDGHPLPPATRTRVCTAAGRRFGFHGQIDGAWYRCCHGHVRKLVDCCGTKRTRINGDASLTGYCYSGRRVFCVMFFETKVPC